MWPWEYAPPARKVRVTRKQLRQIQENYRIAQMQAQDNKELEAKLKEKELAFLEAELDAIPDNFNNDLVLEWKEKIRDFLISLVTNSEKEILIINRFTSILENIWEDFLEEFENIRKQKNLALKELYLWIEDIDINSTFSSEEEIKEIKIISDKAFTNNFFLIDNKVCEYELEEEVLKISENKYYFEKMSNNFFNVWNK